MTFPHILTAPAAVPLATWTGQHADQVEETLAVYRRLDNTLAEPML